MTRDAILEAAAQAFADRGFHAVTMRDLARTLGRSLGAFYNHFDSKEAVLYCIQRDAFDELIDGARTAIADIDDPRTRLYAFILNHLRYFSAQPDVMRVLVHEAGALGGERRAEIRGRKETYRDIARDIIAEILTDAGDIAIERDTYCIFGMLNWTYGWYQPSRHGSPEELARRIHAMALGGLEAA